VYFYYVALTNTISLKCSNRSCGWR